jgi:nucleoside 2-deoxyribosyltransferase
MFRREPQAFVAVPSRDAASSELAEVISSTLSEHGVHPVSPSAAGPSVSLRAQEMLREADFVIADITGANPNVMVEVGMALGMGKRLLLLSQSRSGGWPGDLAQVAVYRPEDINSVRKYLTLWLQDALSDRESSAS